MALNPVINFLVTQPPGSHSPQISNQSYITEIVLRSRLRVLKLRMGSP